MDTFSARDAVRDGPGWRARVAGQLREDGLAVLTGIDGRAALTVLARELMTIRPHRDAAPDGVTEITETGTATTGYAAFTTAGLVPHTDGTAVADPPQLLLLACARPAGEGGATLVADGARVVAALAGSHPGALPALSAPGSARFGTPADGYLGAVLEPAGPGRAGPACGCGSTTSPASRPTPPARSPRCAPRSPRTPPRCAWGRATGSCCATPGGCTAASPTPAPA